MRYERWGALKRGVLFATGALSCVAHAVPAWTAPAHLRPVCEQLLTHDFTERDAIPQSPVPPELWSQSSVPWGPQETIYPPELAPPGVDRLEWQRSRVIAAAKRLTGLPYAHYHFPAMGGLDCSNFTAWIYNFALGIQIDSNVVTQSETAGRKLEPSEPLQPGDLLFIYNKDMSKISHVVVWIGPTIIDSTLGKLVGEREYVGHYKERAAWARRVLE